MANGKIDDIIKTAFLLGAGIGTRFRPFTDTCPKPLLPINGRPIITYVMDHLLAVGIKRFIVNTHHLPHVYEEVFPDHLWRGVPIIFRYEPVLLDSAGGLKNIEDLLDGDDRNIIAYNADIVTDMPLGPLIEGHFKYGGEVTLALRSEGYLKNVDVDLEGKICDIRHLRGQEGVRCCQFASIYVVGRRFLKRMRAGRIESVVDVFIRMLNEDPAALRGVIIDEGMWEAVNDVEVYNRLKDISRGPNL
ncbi:MAG: NTP transferase domain-containing protein [Deltaproteobacteria bacterium]|nr:NTP transferase domain-containing protein [Deltaproteobacteria bacterium]